MDYSFTKIWDDNNDQDGLREDITVTLYKNTTTNPDKAVKHDDVLLKKGETSYTWHDLPVRDGGETITWTIKETPVPNGYTSSVNDETHEITNTHKPGTTEFSFTKIWDDVNNQDGLRGTYVVTLYKDGVSYADQSMDAESTTWTWGDLPARENGKTIVWTIDETFVPNGYTKELNGSEIHNHHDPTTVDYTVTKIWDDDDDRDGLRNEYTVTLYKNGVSYSTKTLPKESLTYIWTNLPEFENGVPNVWTVDETGVPDGYTKDVQDGVITNSHDPAATDISITKVWDDDDNRDGMRGSFTVTLYKDGVSYQDVTLDKDSTTYTWKDLPVREKGVTITWTVDETVIPAEYDKSVNGFVITNKHDPHDPDYTVILIWDDEDNRDDSRDEYTVTLYKNGEPYDTITFGPETTSYTWRGLYEYEDGKTIVWTVNETGVPSGYEPSIEEVTLHKTTIRNTLQGTLIVTKTVSGNDCDKEKEFVFTVALSDTKVYGQYGDLTFTDGKATFTLKDGQSVMSRYHKHSITYTVTEEDYTSDGYVMIAQPGVSGTFTPKCIDRININNIRNTTGELTVTNEVEKDAGDPEKEFYYIVELDDPTINGEYGSMTFVDGKATFTLKGGDSITANDLPNGVHFTVTQADYSDEGYYTTWTGATGTIDDEKPALAAFFNTLTPPGNHFIFTKKWSGGHLDGIKFTLYDPDGVPVKADFEKFVVTEDEWRYEAWFVRSADYYLIEEVPTGYSVLYQNIGKHASVADRCYNGGTIINTKLPPTGDTVPLPLLIGLLVLSLSCATFTLTCGRKRRKN